MKKLLLGALLVVGATSFAASNVTTGDIAGKLPTSNQNAFLGNIDPAGNGSTSEGSVSLDLITKGTVIAPAENDYYLVITPTLTYGPGTDSITFNFNDMTPGQTQSLVGKFKAEILTNDGTNNQLVNLKPIVDDGKISAYLTLDGVTEEKAIRNLALISDVDGTTEVGDLNYALNTGLDGEYSFVGDVTAEVIIDNTAKSTTFRNIAADVVVKVEAGAITVTNP